MTHLWRQMLRGVALLTLLLPGCAGLPAGGSGVQATLTEVATSQRQWTGVAVSHNRRIFVNFPRGSAGWGPSVAELRPDGQHSPYPNYLWNAPGDQPGSRQQEHFISVQSLFIDAADFLWVLDSANPHFTEVVPGGPKLVRIDLRTNKVVLVIALPTDVVLPKSYLHDLRVDLRSGTAYITDSGLGALIVTDIAEETSRRLLSGHPSVTSEGTIVNVAGKAWRLADGSLPEVHLAGLALTPGGEYLYYQALTGRTLYRVPLSFLRDPELSTEDLEKGVQMVGQTCVADGMTFARDGYLYLTDIEQGAIRRLNRDGRLELVVQDPRLVWPDSLAVAVDGALYVTTSRIHLPDDQGPYRLFRLELH